MVDGRSDMLTCGANPVMVVGYVVRIICYENTDSLPLYIMQSLFILLPPTLFAASIYMTLSRVIRSVDAGHLSIVRPTRLTKLFVWGDIITLNIQGTGGGLTSETTRAIGEKIILAGLALQVMMFGFFCAVIVNFHIRLRRSPTTASVQPEAHWRQNVY